MNRLNVGIIGCGEVTQIIHLPTLAFLSDHFAVTALCDVSAQVVQAVGEHWRVAQQYTGYRELLAQPDVDAVLVATPDVYHSEVTLAALAAGKHVLVEKPMCLTLREADEIQTAQAQAGVIVQVGTMRRYAPAFIEACSLVAGMQDIRYARSHDVIGQNFLFIRATSRVERGEDIPVAMLEEEKELRAARIREAIGDAPPELRAAYGLMLGLSSHDLSAMREMLGMPRRVLYAAQRRRGSFLTAAFDYGDFVCQFESGADDIPRFDCLLEVYGKTQLVRVEYDTPYVRNLPIRVRVTEANGAGGVVERAVHPAWGDAFVSEWQAFHENVMLNRPAKTSPADFRLDLQLFRDMIALMREPA